MTGTELIEKLNSGLIDLSLPIRVAVQNSSRPDNVVDLDIDDVIRLNPTDKSPSLSIVVEPLRVAVENGVTLENE